MLRLLQVSQAKNFWQSLTSLPAKKKQKDCFSTDIIIIVTSFKSLGNVYSFKTKTFYPP